MRLVWIALVCAIGVIGQFENLTTNDDGSRVYFSSSLRMRGSDQVSHSKVFVYDAAGLRLLMQRPLERTTSPDATWPVSNYYSLEAVAVDGTGSRTGIIARRDCYGGSGCLPTPKYRTEIDGGTYRGRMSMSRNGRYGLLQGDGSMVSAAGFVDLQTGESTTWIAYSPPGARYGRRQVSSTGTAVFSTGSSLRVLRMDGRRDIDLPGPATDVVIDDEARFAVYQSADALYSVDINTSAVRKLAARRLEGRMQPAITNDGRTAAFIDEMDQLFVMNLDGTGGRRVTRDPAGIREFVLSGDGRVAYAVTAAGRLVRVEVETANIDELIRQGPSIESISLYGHSVPGSATTVTGRGFASTSVSAAPPLPLKLNGLELCVDGSPVPLQTVAPDRVVFQLPWETTPGSHRVEARTDASPAFESERLEFPVSYNVAPQFVPSGQGMIVYTPYVLAAHSDFGSLVTTDNPARPGEVVHVYMTGLGPVDPPVPSGAAAPSDPPARLTSPLSCTVAPDRNVEVFFAGLAPGFAGYYQVSVRVPENVRSGGVLSCRPPGSPDSFLRSFGWLPTAR